MIQLLFTLVLIEMAVIVALLFRTPLRKLLITGLDLLKQGTGPLIAKTVSGTILVVFSSTLYSAINIRRRTMEAGIVNPTDEVLMLNSLLEASLMGFLLFLAMITDRLHCYMRELQIARRNLEEMKRSQDYDDERKRRKVEETKETIIKSRV